MTDASLLTHGQPPPHAHQRAYRIRERWAHWKPRCLIYARSLRAPELHPLSIEDLMENLRLRHTRRIEHAYLSGFSLAAINKHRLDDPLCNDADLQALLARTLKNRHHKLHSNSKRTRTRTGKVNYVTLKP